MQAPGIVHAGRGTGPCDAFDWKCHRSPRGGRRRGYVSLPPSTPNDITEDPESAKRENQFLRAPDDEIREHNLISLFSTGSGISCQLFGDSDFLHFLN
ncbi:UNVERIFIED_CONTAM: hypothetical protein PYX00_003827 [Menopon gallinae]|uniref:Uncharacterized protein n=1 Tax=Menopon gallinae TaxID=328185 RepID=A0AAW2I240_9NEOP